MMIVETKRPPTKEELEKYYVQEKLSIAKIGKMFGYKSEHIVKEKLKEYKIHMHHLDDRSFKPNDSELFKRQLETNSVSELVKIYNFPRRQIDKYIKNNNLNIGYFKNKDLSNSELIEKLKYDFAFNVGNEYSITPKEIERRLNNDNLSISDISMFNIKEKLIPLMEENDIQEGKRFTHEPRLYKFILNETKDHTLYGDKITERVYRIVNDYKHDQVDKCIKCNKALKFYKYSEGYGFSDKNVCQKCYPSIQAISGKSNISQELFDKIYNIITDKSDVHYANLNKEFVININKNDFISEHTNKRTYSLDFVCKNKIIEFDGNYWHQNPFYESAKDALLTNRGYEILHILDTDYIKNPELVIKQCIEFIEG